MPAIWQKSLHAFAGPGIEQPSEMMRVDADEARVILDQLAELAWLPAVARHSGKQVCNADGACDTAIFGEGRIVGFYAGSYLWIEPACRGHGLSVPLILAAAGQRGGCVMPPGVVHQGYTRAGAAAHRAAYRQALLTAMADGRPVATEHLRQAGLPSPAIDTPYRSSLPPTIPCARMNALACAAGNGLLNR